MESGSMQKQKCFSNKAEQHGLELALAIYA